MNTWKYTNRMFIFLNIDIYPITMGMIFDHYIKKKKKKYLKIGNILVFKL